MKKETVSFFERSVNIQQIAQCHNLEVVVRGRRRRWEGDDD
jgi:hypothetical protein